MADPSNVTFDSLSLLVLAEVGGCDRSGGATMAEAASGST